MMAVVSNDCIQISETMAVVGPPIAVPSVCWQKCPLNLKFVVSSRTSSRSRICLGESRVLSANLSSFSGRSFIMRRAWSMKMVV